MSTRSGIGIKENGKVKGIYCHSNGFIGYNGVMLVDAFKDRVKIKKLIDAGNIGGLGSNLRPNISFPDLNALEDCWRVSRHYRTSFCDSIGTPEEKAIVFNSDYDFSRGIDGEYFYLFDTSKNKWYVIESDTKTKSVKYFDLEKLVKDRDYFVDFYLYHKRFCIQLEEEIDGKYSKTDYMKDAEQEWEMIKDRIEVFNEEKKDGIVKICNQWLHWPYFPNVDITNIEFGISETKELGKHYVIFSALKNGETKRKVLKRSKNINDLTLAVCNQYGFSPYLRPFFESK